MTPAVKEQLNALEKEMMHVQSALCKLKDKYDEMLESLEEKELPVFDIVIEETINQTFKIQASTAEEACEIARTRYNYNDLVVENGEVQNADAIFFDESGKVIKVNIKG